MRTLLLLLTLLLPGAAHAVGAGCQATAGTSVPLEKIRSNATGTEFVGCINRSFEVLATSGVVTASTSTVYRFGQIFVSTISGNPNSNGINVSSYVYVVANASVTLQGAGGYLKTSSSVTASGFFGDVSGVTGLVTAGMVDAAVTTPKLAPGAGTTSKLAADAVTSVAILDGAVTTNKLAPGAATTSKLAADAVTTVAIADTNVTTAKIAPGAVTTSKHAADSVTATAILAGSVTTHKLASGAVTTDKLGPGLGGSATCSAGTVLTGTVSNGIVAGASCVSAGGSGDVVAANVNSFTNQNSFSSHTYQRAEWIGTSTVGITTATVSGIIVPFVDGAVRSSGCVVAVWYDATRGYWVASSTTTDFSAGLSGVMAGVLFETSVPGTVAKIITRGPVEIGDSGVGNATLSVTTSASRCNSTNNGPGSAACLNNICIGHYASAEFAVNKIKAMMYGP